MWILRHPILTGASLVALGALALTVPTTTRSTSCSARDVTGNGSSSPDLQGVINEASVGSVIDVSGTCFGHFVIEQAITLRYADPSSLASLDGGSSGRVLTIASSGSTPAAITLRGLRLQHGLADGSRLSGAGGAISGSGVALHIVASKVIDNYANKEGGGIFVRGSLVMTDSLVKHNSTGANADGGGIYAQGPVLLSDSVVKANDAGRGGGIFARGVTLAGKSAVTKNSAGINGGGMWTRGPVQLLDSSEVSKNTARYGGGLFNSGELGKVGIRMSGHATVDRNVAFGSTGGGIYAQSAATVMSGRSTIRRNATLSNPRGGGGGGIHISEVLTMKDHALIANNSTVGFGGGVFADHYERGLGLIMLDASAIRGNVALGGGGVLIWEANGVLRDRAVIRGNTATDTGGGILTWSVKVHVHDSAQVRGNSPNNIVNSHL